MIIDRYRRRSHPGQGLPEYAIVIALVAIVCIIILGLVGLAATRNYGLVAGALGAKKEVRGDQNYIYFDTNPPQCGTILSGPSGVGTRLLYAQFFSDFDFENDKSYTVATDTGLVPEIVKNTPSDGSGNWTVNVSLSDGEPCPNSIVIQLPKSKGGGTLAYTVQHKDWGS